MKENKSCGKFFLTHKKLFISMAVAFLVIAIGTAMFGKFNKKPVVKVEFGVGALGRIEPISTIINVQHENSVVNATVDQLFVNEGDVVKKDQKIAVLSSKDSNFYRHVSLQKNLEVLKANLESKNAELKRAKKEFERRLKLEKSKAISLSLKNDSELRLKKAEAGVASLNAQIAVAEAKKDGAKDVLEKSTLTAPIAGTILKINTYSGELIGREGVVEIADLSRLQVIAEVFELDVHRVKVGQKATITIAGDKKEFSGKVNKIGYIVEKNSLVDTNPSKNRDNRIVEVKIIIDKEHLNFFKHLLLTKVHVKIHP